MLITIVCAPTSRASSESACLLYYAWHRRRSGLPVFGSVKHDWEQEQIEVLTNAEEFESLEQYKQALIARDE